MKACALEDLPLEDPREEREIAESPRPLPVFWQGVFQRFGKLNRTQVAVAEVVSEYPLAGHGEIAKTLGISAGHVRDIRAESWFGPVLCALALAKNPMFTAKTAILQEMLLDRMLKSAQENPKWIPGQDERQLLEGALKRAGLLQPDQHFHFDAAGGKQEILIVNQRLNEVIDRALEPFREASKTSAVTPSNCDGVTQPAAAQRLQTE